MPRKKTASKSKKPIKQAAQKPKPELSLKSKISQPKLSFKNPKRAVIISSVIFVLAVVIAWWQFIFAEPGRVLSGMVDNNLRSSGIVKEVKQSSGQNTINQDTYLSFIDGPRSQAVTTLQQTTDSGTNKVVTENVGTPGKDYIRYRKIDLSGPAAQRDTSAAVNIWAARPQEGRSIQQANFLNEALFSVVSFGNFHKQDASQLKATIDQNGIYDYSEVKRQFEDGRLVYKYQMKFQPVVLINYLAEYSKLLGIDHKGQLDAANYQGAQSVEVVFTVDVLSRQLRKIEYTNTGRVENYSGYGLTRPIELPEATISVEELQGRLQQ